MTAKTLDETTLKQWIGKTQSTSANLYADQAQLMQTTFDQAPSLADGDALPPLWHWAYFLSGAPMSTLGRDGHPKKGRFLPPVDLPRRMWAGGRFEFMAPVKLGEHITKTSIIKDVTLKSGRSGVLCFVTVAHAYTDDKTDIRFLEEHDIVYRQDPAPDAPTTPPPDAPLGSQSSETITPDPVQLFRYSALTFNGHRIHYDRDYCRDVEGYPGLIFHGPLTATLLANFAQENAGNRMLKTFDFRATSPLYDTTPFTIHFDGKNTVWAQNPDGKLAMKASAIFC